MPKLRVLFADDQYPADAAEANAFVKQAILERKGAELRRKGKDPDRAFEEDLAWFTTLRAYMVDRFDVNPARSFADAQRKIRDGEFDVAVIDLSWPGDATIDRDPHNAGLELLDELARSVGTRKHAIAFSQNYRDDPELMSLVSSKGALPVPKYYDHTGLQALAAAIRYLANDPVTSNRDNVRDLSLLDFVTRTPLSQLWAVVAAAIAVLGSIATWSYNVGAGKFPFIK